MKKVLFVDDEPNVLQGLERMLRPLRREWEIAFASSGAEALEALALRPFDVLVSDMRMPGMNGVELMTAVMERHPQIVRIILSGYADQEVIMRSLGPAHQYISKPCDADTIKLTVGRACALRDLLADETLQLLVSQMQTLPSLPALYAELVKELRSEDASIRRIAEVISRDVGMTAKILQMVNSAFFAVRRHISDPTEAVSLLGVDMVMRLALTIQVFKQFNHARLAGFSPEALWSHSLRVGLFAKRIAQSESVEPEIFNSAFTAGLLHDVGHLVLIANRPQQYARMLQLARTDGCSYHTAEKQVFGATHAEVGAYLLGLWGLPSAIVETVAFHHRPSECLANGFGLLTAVHVANVLEAEMQAVRSGQSTGYAATLDLDYLSRLGLLKRLNVWQELCSEIDIVE